METERTLCPIAVEDLQELYDGSMCRLSEYFIDGDGKKWNNLYK